ncbi:MAG: ankyrin repeat domain-containing protein, partial [Gammaproteobacteria bacterium]|nr:ankyrin repeat domain-containing protein [Gammaproteobacteria bacterium]
MTFPCPLENQKMKKLALALLVMALASPLIAQQQTLHEAAMSGDADAVRALIEAGADVEARRNDRTPIFFAAVFGHADAVRALIEAGADIGV